MSRKKVTIIDYGMGNLKSLYNAFEFIDAKVTTTNNIDDIYKSEITVLPGVGSYRKAMKEIKDKNIDEAIYRIIEKGNYLLCICLGMQLLGSSSNEEKYTKGLNIVKNKVQKFTTKETKKNDIPHVGFNKVNNIGNLKVFNGIENNSDFYFVHSYRMKPEKLKKNISITNYGSDFLSYFEVNNVLAAQFHPEKSQSNGIRFLTNFLKLT